MAVLERVAERLLRSSFVDLGTLVHWDHLCISYTSECGILLL